MNTTYIYHHLGLGDHIIANGLVRTIAEQYDKVYLFCKPHNIKNISFMYRDLSKLKIITMDDKDVKQFMNLNPQNNYLIVGHEKFTATYKSKENKLTIDEIFYSMANVPIENKWKKFHINRNIEREKEIFKNLISIGESYAFIHDDHNRNITKQIPDMKIIRPSMEYSLFDYLFIIENAAEIHCINSSFFCLIDCIGINKKNMYIHKYTNPNTSIGLLGKIKSNWKIL